MPFLRSTIRALAVCSLITHYATAQTCYYPDGTQSTTDTPCGNGNGATSCCGANAWCLSDGLCFDGAIVSRGSCTDKSWGSEACAGYCKTASPSGSIAIMPCPASNGDNMFACGITNSGCNTGAFTMAGGASLVLRQQQATALVQGSLSANATVSGLAGTVTVTAAADTTGLHTAGEMAGLGFGLAIPLLVVSAFALYLYRRDRDRTPKLMYPLPDDCKDDYSFRRPPPSIQMQPPAYRSPVQKDNSDAQSLHTLHSSHSTQPPTHMMSFMERYQAIKENLRIQERVELEATSREPDRHELGDRRMSAKSDRSFQTTKSAKSAVSRAP